MVSEEGGRLLCVVGARGLFSAAPLCRGGTEVTAWSHPAVPPRPHPGHAHTKPLGLSAAKDPFLKVKIFVPLCTSCPTETRLFPFLPTSTCNHPNTQPEELCGGAVGRSQCAAQHPRWKGEGQSAEGQKSLGAPRHQLQQAQAARIPRVMVASAEGEGWKLVPSGTKMAPPHLNPYTYAYKTGSPPSKLSRSQIRLQTDHVGPDPKPCQNPRRKQQVTGVGHFLLLGTETTTCPSPRDFCLLGTWIGVLWRDREACLTLRPLPTAAPVWAPVIPPGTPGDSLGMVVFG